MGRLALSGLTASCEAIYMKEQSTRQINVPSVGFQDIQMLDHTLQSLFGLGLKLEYCIEMVDESPQQAKDGLEAVIGSLSELMQPIRDRIMELK